jgi:hypothetical protein
VQAALPTAAVVRSSIDDDLLREEMRLRNRAEMEAESLRSRTQELARDLERVREESRLAREAALNAQARNARRCSLCACCSFL